MLLLFVTNPASWLLWKRKWPGHPISAATSSLACQPRGTGARTKLTLNQERKKSGLFSVTLLPDYLLRSLKITRNPYLHCCLLMTLRRTILALDRRKQIPWQHTIQAEVLTYQKNRRKKSSCSLAFEIKTQGPNA